MRVHLALALAVLPAAAQRPFVPLDGVVNGANYLPGCAPNGGIAQGALFTVFGSDLGPRQGARVTVFPLTESLAGVSLRVDMAGLRFASWPVYVGASQVGAILPAAVPVGDGTLVLTYNGQISDPVPIRVRRNAPGLFTVNQRGTGPLAMDPSAQTLRPGQLAAIWATGLGPAPGNEAAGPIPGDLTEIDTRVWVGDRTARVLYRGRSGCCAGIDQIIFEIPAGIEGCQVPVNIEAGGVSSNFGSIAIAASGTCRGAQRLPPVSGARPDFRFGLTILIDGFGSVLLPSALDDYVRLAFFQRGRVEGDVEAPLHAFEANAEVPPGLCSVRYGVEFPPQPEQPNQVAMDAGTDIGITGPGGTFRIAQSELNARRYEDPRRVVIPAGRYRISNGPGGRDVGPFGFDTELITLRMLSRRERIPRSEDLRVTWDYQGPPEHLLTVFGSSRGACGRELISFSCVAHAGDGEFRVPARILSLLPPSTSIFGVSNGALNISTVTPGGLRRFTAPGLDLGLFVQISISAIRPLYE